MNRADPLSGARETRSKFSARTSGRLAVATAIGLLGLSTAWAAAPTPYERINAAAAADQVRIRPVSSQVAMLEGSGGNIGVLSGRDGQLMVDAGIAVSKEKIRAALRRLGPGRIRYLVTTHWHWDHADGNSWVSRTGATMLAHPGAIRRLSGTYRVVEWGHTFTPVAAGERPKVAVTAPRTLAFDGERIVIRPYAAGHTDTDLSVYFTKADVLQTGDTFWNGQYPFIDYVGGGSIDGAIRAANANIRLAGRATKVIPGHGPIGSRGDLVAFRDMLVTVRSRVAALKAKGLSADAVVAARPTASLDPL